MKIETNAAADCIRPHAIAEIAPLGSLIGTVAKHLRRKFEEQAKHHELTLPQWKVLAQLATNSSVSQSALAGMVETDPMTISGILDRLEARGLVERAAHPSDSRAKVVSATALAQTLVDEMRAVASDVYGAMLHGISQDERETLVSILNRISENLAGPDRRQDESK